MSTTTQVTWNNGTYDKQDCFCICKLNGLRFPLTYEETKRLRDALTEKLWHPHKDKHRPAKEVQKELRAKGRRVYKQEPKEHLNTTQ
jgi:hypothetical protein